MKLFATLFTAIFFSNLSAQEHINLKKGLAAEGYDVVAYFNNEALKGSKEFATEYKGASYQFSSLENLKTFEENSKRYVPQYGGYCAYAIAVKNEKIGINPKTFQIIDDKLYLFYNSWGANTLEIWNEENPEKLKEQADINWEEIVKKKN